MWAWLKAKLVGSLKERLLAEVVKLDRYEPELAALAKKYVDPDVLAKKLVDFIQEKLRELVEKVL